LTLRLLPIAVVASVALHAASASAQTWAGTSTTPSLRELVAVDQTGEPRWLFGAEDVAGDGPATFNDAEQAADVRSGYAATDAERLWLRVYVSADTAPAELQAFVFVDSDHDATTGGPGSAPEVDAALDASTAPGGYEFLIGWSGERFLGAWRWAQAPSRFQPLGNLDALEAVTEQGAALDPLRLNGARNGYVQVALKFVPLELSVGCDANLLFRSTSGTLRDRDLGRVGPCRPGDANDNDIADVAEPDSECDTDDQCPAGGACNDQRCEAPAAAPDSGSSEAFVLEPGEAVQGGALTCDSAAAPAPASQRWLGLAALGLLILLQRGLRRPAADREGR
jgi:hypothetical protein